MPTLARRRLGIGKVGALLIIASSPMTVLVGGIPSTYQGSGSAGVPLAFLIVMGLMALLGAAYLRVTQYVTHTAPFVAVLARGLGAAAGVPGAIVMFVGYNAIQISLAGFLGMQMSGLVGGSPWRWVFTAWVLVAVGGLLRMSVNAAFLGLLLLVELAVVGLFLLAAFTNLVPSAGPSPFSFSALSGPGMFASFALTVAAFVGVEAGPAYGEEARSGRTVTVATFSVVGLLGVLYALMAAGVRDAIGLAQLTGDGDPTALVFELLRRTYGPAPVMLATLLLVTSVLGAMASFHLMIARQVFGLGRDGLLPKALAWLSGGTGGGTPAAGSLVQSVCAGVTLGLFAYFEVDPMIMFIWLSTGGALFVLALMVSAAGAAYGFYQSGEGGNEGAFWRVVAPGVGAVLGVLLLAAMAANLKTLPMPDGSRMWLLPLAVLGGCIAAGAIWAGVLKLWRPAVLRRLGYGTPDPVITRDARLDEIEV